MIAGFKKPKRNFSGSLRRKNNDNVAEDEGTGSEEAKSWAATARPIVATTIKTTTQPAVGQGLSIPNQTSVKIKNKKLKEKTGKPKGLLSFEDDIQDAEEFQVKKSKESKWLSKMVEQEKEEKKKRKKKKEVCDIDSRVSKLQIEAVYGMSPVGSTNGGSGTQSPSSIYTEEIRTLNEDEIEQFEFSNVKVGLSSGVIPDASTIYALKKKREIARQLGTGADYVPVEDTIKYEGRFTSGKSRLVREDDGDSSDDERIEMRGLANNAKHFPALERRKEVAKALEEAHDQSDHEEEENDEINEWECEQMRKGVGIPAGQSEPTYGPQIPVTFGQEIPFLEAPQVLTGSVDANSYVYMSGSLPLPPMPPMVYSFSGFQGSVPQEQFPFLQTYSQTVTVDMVTQKLKERLDSVEQVHRAHKLEQDKVRTDFESSESNIITLERNSGDVSDRFTFYQDSFGYVRDLLECLNEKVPAIEQLEKSIHNLWRHKAEKLVQRRIDDMKDEDSQISGKVISKEKVLDEFGRDRSAFEDNARQRRIAEREGRRQRRRKVRLKRGKDHHEGMSTDDEEQESEKLRFKADKDKISKESDTIFEDVVEDFTSLKIILSRFEEWKFGFHDSYKEAYINLCLPKLFTPFLKMELLQWNPLQMENEDFEYMTWYKTLLTYGYHEGSDDKEDEDINLIPLIIEKVLLPKLTELIDTVWDPLSTTQSKLATMLIQRLVDDYPTIKEKSKNTMLLFNAVIERIKRTIEQEIYIPLYHKGLLDNKNSGALQFLEREFWVTVKLFGNIMLWNGLLSQAKLQEIGLDGVLSRYLVVALQQLPDSSENLEKCKIIVTILPKSWLEAAEQVVPGLQSFSRYLNILAGNVYKSSLGYTDQEKRKAKMTIKKIISMLMHIQDFDLARTVAKDYKLETKKDDT